MYLFPNFVKVVVMSFILEAEKIIKKYNVNSTTNQFEANAIKIKRGVIYLIKGKSGSGKTTLLNMLAGLDKPSSGTITYEGISFYNLSDEKQSKIRNEKFGFVFQQYNLIPEMSVYENIKLPLYFNSKANENDEEITRLAEELDIKELLNNKAMKLSGGQQQRVAIARALITKPCIIFADEPTGNLDTETSKRVVNLLINSVKKRSTTLILVTHEEQLINVDHTLICIDSGKIVEMREIVV